MSFTKEKREQIQLNLMELINSDDFDFIQKLIKKYSLTATSIRQYPRYLLRYGKINISLQHNAGESN